MNSTEKKLIEKFLSTQADNINNNNWEKFYNDLYQFDHAELSHYRDNITPLITHILINIGINPLLYLKEVPDSYAQDLNITNIDIPNNITSIGMYAFDASSLVTVNLSDNLEKIKCGAFYNCTDLQSISFPSSLKQIDQDVFYNCKNLKNIRYEGTIKQFDSNVIIEIDNNDPLFENIISCKDGKIIADINNWTDEITWNRVK